MNLARRIGLGLVVAVAAVGLSSCGQAPWEDSLRDYEGAEVRDPGSITLWNNIDQHPNLARVCADGVAFLTTTRPDFSAVQRVPEWDAACKGVRDTVMTK